MWNVKLRECSFPALLWYGLQRGCDPFGVDPGHDDDWEHVTVNFVRRGQSWRQDSVTFCQHGGFYTRQITQQVSSEHAIHLALSLEPLMINDCLIIFFWWIYTNNKWSTVIVCPPAAPQRVRGQGGARALRHAVWRLGAVAGPSLLHRGLRLLGGLQVGGTPRHCSWCVAPPLRNDNENTRWLPHNIRHVSEVTGDQVNR